MTDLKSKIKERFDKFPMLSLATLTEDVKPWVRYVMSRVDDDLTVRFSTFVGSRKIAHIKNNQEVHITCGVASMGDGDAYLQVQGKAKINTSTEDRNDYWDDKLKAFFTSPDDPNYCVVVVKPYRIEYMAMASMTPEV